MDSGTFGIYSWKVSVTKSKVKSSSMPTASHIPKALSAAISLMTYVHTYMHISAHYVVKHTSLLQVCGNCMHQSTSVFCCHGPMHFWLHYKWLIITLLLLIGSLNFVPQVLTNKHSGVSAFDWRSLVVYTCSLLT